VRKVEISNEYFEELFGEFVGDIVHLPRTRSLDEERALKRLYPKIVRKMFFLWYEISHHAIPVILKKDQEKFFRSFEKALLDHDILCVRHEMKKRLDLIEYGFRYSLSRCRLNDFGNLLYSRVKSPSESGKGQRGLLRLAKFDQHKLLRKIKKNQLQY
jgi:hypothetical protein